MFCITAMYNSISHMAILFFSYFFPFLFLFTVKYMIGHEYSEQARKTKIFWYSDGHSVEWSCM